MIIVVFGLPASGKSYFATHLARIVNADYINSDRVRRIMFPDRTYSTEETLSVYDEMLAQMRQKIKQHRNVVVDATFHRDEIRRKFFEAAEEVDRIIYIEVRAEELLVKERLKRSREDSEADFHVYRKIKNKWQPLYEDHLILHSTDDNLNAMLEKTAGHLQQMNDKRTNK